MKVGNTFVLVVSGAGLISAFDAAIKDATTRHTCQWGDQSEFRKKIGNCFRNGTLETYTKAMMNGAVNCSYRRKKDPSVNSIRVACIISSLFLWHPSTQTWYQDIQWHVWPRFSSYYFAFIIFPLTSFVFHLLPNEAVMTMTCKFSRKETRSVRFLAHQRLTRFDIVCCHVITAAIVVHFQR